ncbi:MAG TPA: amino acid ABC transporter permease [Candidatus Mcinerneyibacteriales bacterium]|nr:amino acid ABC transporter permease [Candidatus Mcinerneyibacteriales bacterium]
MDFSKILTFVPYFLPAAWMTLKITTMGILIGLMIGFPIAFGRLSRRRFLSLPSKGYIALIRGTPLLLQLFVVYYGLVRLVALDPLPSAALALGVHNGAYIAEIIRGAIQSINRGQMEAARSLGMTHMQAMRRIIIPQALLRALPPLGNQFIIALKDSSLASTVTVRELVLTSRQLASSNFMMMEMLAIAAVFYLILTGLLTLLVNHLEVRMSVSRA